MQQPQGFNLFMNVTLKTGLNGMNTLNGVLMRFKNLLMNSLNISSEKKLSAKQIIQWEYTWEYQNLATQIDLSIGIFRCTHSHHIRIISLFQSTQKLQITFDIEYKNKIKMFIFDNYFNKIIALIFF